MLKNPREETNLTLKIGRAGFKRESFTPDGWRRELGLFLV